MWYLHADQLRILIEEAFDEQLLHSNQVRPLQQGCTQQPALPHLLHPLEW